jgi:hypothetical protein
VWTILRQAPPLPFLPAEVHGKPIIALALLYAGKTGPAMALFEEGVAAGFIGSHGASFVLPLLRRGDRIGAMLLLQELGASPELAVILIRSVEHPGKLSPADTVIADRAMATTDIAFLANLGAATTYQWLGEYDRIATAKDFSAAQAAQWEPDFPGFRNSPGFKAVLERSGVAAYWWHHGFPPQCRSVGAQDYTCN